MTDRSPAQHSGEIVACPQRQHSDRREGFDGQFVDDREDPAYSAITSASQDTNVTEIPEHLETVGEGGREGGSECV